MSMVAILEQPPCCSAHRPGRSPLSCCDTDDCGPCCERCPTCPTLQRDRAREVAVALEQQLASVAEIHRPEDLGVTWPATGMPAVICVTDGEHWPCETAVALGVER